ncbi:chitin synthase [Plakobranchus ocellatus]|uniref:chitin synthase n=1 Tax=Plakobranchus ocellatus TaxID=259542 RepID=A0AAV4CYP2_9GAST|nr:chitin synthase [Plakobranchus ocellatus]
MASSVTSDGYTVYTGANRSRDFLSPPSTSWSYKNTTQLSQKSSDKNFKQDLSADSEESIYEKMSSSVSRGGSPFPVDDCRNSSSDEDDPLRISHRYHHQQRISTNSNLGIGVRESFDTYSKFDPTRNQTPFPPAAALHRQRFRSLPAIDVPSDLVDHPKPRRKLSVDHGTDKKTSSRRGSMPPACKCSSPKTSDLEKQESKLPKKAKKKEPRRGSDESGISLGSSSKASSATASNTDSDSSNADQKVKKGKAKNTKDEKKDDKGFKWRPYNLFSTKEIEFDDEKVFHEILKVIRCCLYGFIILVMLVGTVANRISLSLMANNINRDKGICGESVVHLVLCLCAPLIFNWINALMKILFGGKQWPSFKFFAANLIFELLTTFGWCLLVFRVLPSTDFFRGITVTLGIFQFPSFLKSLHLPSKCTCLAPVRVMCGFLAMVAQIGCPIYFLVKGFGTVPFAKDLGPGSPGLLENLEWDLPVAVWLVSLTWWENYISKDWSFFGYFRPSMKRFCHALQETRETSCFLTTPFKVGLVVALGRFLPDVEFSLFGWDPASGETMSEFYAVHYSLFCILLGSAILCTYLGSLACKLQMQRAAFAFPLILSPPASLAVVYLQCQYEFLPMSWNTGAWYCPELTFKELLEPCVAAFLLWISYCVIVSQIWFPKVERMAKIEKMFLTPHFSSVLPDFNLTLRRKRDSKKLNPELSPNERKKSDKTSKDNGGHSANTSDKDVPTIYICATLWHENKQEMTQLLKSLFRLDYSHCASKQAQARFKIRDPDFYETEMHIMFDDAYELDKETKKYVPNSYVRLFIECMEEAARSVLKGFIVIPSPVKVATPYGGQLVWTMPGQNKLVVHLKDKNRIRHRKRWSQIMYMYYLLGLKLLGAGDGTNITNEDHASQHQNSATLRNRKRADTEKIRRKNLPFRQLLTRMSRSEYDQLVDKSENTFILTLDGDIDFKPEAVKLLVDRMKKNKKVAAACGRIHPIGAGPLVWYQQFEYAVGHWLQKAAEHVFGCVLCCPGCFSLFRASALMDDNVLKTYTMKPTEARHYIQYEQGEDRWLCTLLLQQGYRIEYSACSDAYTFAPETFTEFFHQRRRWSPSTLANILDLLGSWRNTTRLNDNISRLFILYQLILVVATIIAPSFLVLLITFALNTVLGISTLWSYFLSIAPVALYIYICLKRSTDTQIRVGAVMSAGYSVVMMIIAVSTMISIVQESFTSPNVIFVTLLISIVILTSFMHPQEFSCVVPGVIYFLTIPANFLLLTVFYMCNLNNVTWGTREIARELTPEEKAQIEAERIKKEKSWNIFSASGLKNIVAEIRELISTVWGLRKDLESPQGQPTTPQQDEPVKEVKKPAKEPLGIETDPDNPSWLQAPTIGDGPVEALDKTESEFWKFMIKIYLYPIDKNEDEQKKVTKDLNDLRNNMVFSCIMLNLLWTVIALELQAAQDDLKKIYLNGRHEPMSVFFLAVFAIVIVVQFLGMLSHRWGTFLHFMSNTHVDWFNKSHTDEEFVRYVIKQIEQRQNFEPEVDSDEQSSDEGSLDQTLQTDFEDDENSTYNVELPQVNAGRNCHTGASRDPNEDIFPDFSMRKPSIPGHFPRLEKILDHHMNQQNRRSNRGNSLRRLVRTNSNWSTSSDGSKKETNEWDRSWSHFGSGAGGDSRRHDKNRHSWGWNAKNQTMRDRFLRLSHGIEEETIYEEDGSLRSIKVT